MLKQDIKYSLLILLLAIAGYWEISLFQYSLKDDMMNAVLPWKYFYGECLQHNMLPLWNPYQQVGYPIHADLQYSIWYPESIIIGFFSGYSNLTLHLLFTFYIFMAGLGMYRLIRFFKVSQWISFLTGVTFMFSGVFIGHTQSMVSILGAVWLPWVISEYCRMIYGRFNWYAVLRAVFFTFMMVSGGYQAVTIILFYLFILLFLIELIKNSIQKDFINLRSLFLKNLVWFGGVLLLSSAIIISLYYVIPYVGRLGGVAFADASKFPFSPQSLISILFPFAVVKENTFFDTDVSITNMYFGVISLLFFILGLYGRKTLLHRVLLYFGLASLLLSFGSYLPLWKLAYSYLPFMNLFKYPCFFRFFALIAILITAAIRLDRFDINDILQRRQLYRITSAMLLVVVIAVTWSFSKIPIHKFSFFSNNNTIFQELVNSSIYENLFINGLITSVMLIALLITARFFSKHFKWMVTVLIITDMLISVQLNMFYTGCNEIKPIQVRKEINKKIEGFPVPVNDPVSSNTDQRFSSIGLWRNTNIFNKSVSFDSYTSFVFKNYQLLQDSIPSLKDSLLSHPLVFLSNSSIGETCFITRFQPQHIQVKTINKNNQQINLLQSNYPGWKVSIDGRDTKHFTSNHLFISAILPAGNHTVDFIYDNVAVRKGFVISIITFIVLVLVLTYMFLKKNLKRFSFTVFLSFIVILILISGFTYFKNEERKNKYTKDYSDLSQKLKQSLKSNPNSCFIANVDNPYLLDSISQLTKPVFYLGTDDEINKQIIDSLCRKHDPVFYVRLNRFENNLALYQIFQHKKEVCYYQITTSQSNISFSHTEKPSKNYFCKTDDFEGSARIFSIGGMIDDTCGYLSSHSNRLNPGDQFTTGFKEGFQNLPPDYPLLMGISADIMQIEKAPVFIVLEVYENKKQKLYKAQDISKWFNQSKRWYKGVFADMFLEYPPGDSLSMYIYNPEGKMLWIDNISFEVTGMNPQ